MVNTLEFDFDEGGCLPTGQEVYLIFNSDIVNLRTTLIS